MPTMPGEENSIDMSTLLEEWRLAKQHTDNYSRDFPSLDNLVDAVPINHEDNTPYVGDTTLAGLVRSIPRDSLQQLPIFGAKVNGSKESVQAQIASYILRRGVFNEDTFGKGILSTVQVGAEQALTHGYAPAMTATGSMFDEFGTTMRILHYSDCAPEPGIQDANESGYFFVSANLTKSRVYKIKEAALNNPNTSWNVEALQLLCDMQPESRNYSIYQSDARKQGISDNSPTFQFVTKYEVGKGGRFITFCPQLSEMPLRVIANKSKFGYPRVQFLVIDPAPLSPFGISRVRLASPSQNLMNAYYANVTSMLILNSDPPLSVRGRFNKPVQLKRGARWEATDQNAKAELVTMDNGTLEHFPAMAKQMSFQIQTVMGKINGAMSGGDNSLGFSKTAPGVKQAVKYDDTAINQITNILENFLRQYALVALDTYLAEQTSENYDPMNPALDTLILDDEAKNAINNITPNAVGDDNKLQIDWNQFYGEIESLSVDIELSITKDELEEKQRGDIQDMLAVLTQNAQAIPGAPEKVAELTDMLLQKAVPSADLKPLSGQPQPTIPAAATPVQPTAQTPQSDQVTINQ